MNEIRVGGKKTKKLQKEYGSTNQKVCGSEMVLWKEGGKVMTSKD